MAGLNKGTTSSQEPKRPDLPTLIPTSAEDLKTTVTPAAAKEEKEATVRKPVMLKASIAKRFARFQADNMGTDRVTKFSPLTNELYDQFLTAEGYPPENE